MAGWTLRLALGLALLTCGGLAPLQSACAEEPATAAPAGSIPFPTNKSQTLRGDGKVFVVDGHVVIPKKVEIGVEWGTKIVGINGAQLEVLGGLKVRGTVDHWVVIEDVDFSPTTAPFKGVHLDMVDFKRCRFVHGEGQALEGTMTIENSTFQTGCEFDVCVRKGTLSLLTTVWRPACAIRCAAPVDTKPDIMIQVRSSKFRDAVVVSGHGDATFRHNAFEKGLTCRNVLTLMVDGCDIHDGLVIRQAAKDRFKKVKLTKCNIWNGAGVTLHREPAQGQKKEKVFLQKFYFGTFDGSEPTLDTKTVAGLVTDGEGSIKARLDKPRKKKHLLVNYDIWTTRPPQLHG